MGLLLTMRRGFVAVAAMCLLLAAPAFAAGTKEAARESVGASLVVAETDATLDCLDADGKTVRLSKRPARAIVNYTSLVAIWYRAGGVAVGMPETKSLSDLPEAARALASTGHTAAPNVEAILALEPSLVILAANMEKQRAVAEVLSASGIETLLVTYENYGDFVGLLDLFYRLNGKAMDVDAAAVAMRDAVDGIVARSAVEAAKAPVKFLSLFASARDVQSETDSAHTAYLAKALGGVNAVAYEAPSRSKTRLPFSIERIHMEDPDVIFVTTMGDSDAIREKMRKDFMESDVWKGLKAVRTGRVHFLPNDLFLYKPNDRFPEAFEYLSGLLYPGRE